MTGDIDMCDLDLPKIRVNREELIKNSYRYRMGSVRLAMGMVYTQEQFDKEKEKVLKTPLP